MNPDGLDVQMYLKDSPGYESLSVTSVTYTDGAESGSDYFASYTIVLDSPAPIPTLTTFHITVGAS